MQLSCKTAAKNAEDRGLRQAGFTAYACIGHTHTTVMHSKICAVMIGLIEECILCG